MPAEKYGDVIAEAGESLSNLVCEHLNAAAETPEPRGNAKDA
jgi:hypothetical protein